MTIVVGLTGGIATGKSTISEMFKNKNVPVIDSDHLAKKVVEVDKPAYHEIIDTFGKEILLCTGHLNRKKLAKKVFNDEAEREKLNDIVHPEVRKQIEEEIKKYSLLGFSIIVVDVPLLFESQFDEFCDVTVVVFTDKKTQFDRLMKRDNLDCLEAEKRIEAQWDMKDKLRKADFKIDNSLSILETRKQFNTLMKKLLEMEAKS